MHRSTKAQQVRAGRRVGMGARVPAVVLLLWFVPVAVAAWVVAVAAGGASAAVAAPRPIPSPAGVAPVALVSTPAVRAPAGARRSAPALPAAAAAQSPGRVAVLRTEASRPNGAIGKWVVTVLLALLAALWITLAAVIVRVHTRIASDRE